MLIHAGNFGSNYAERFLACFEPTGLSVYGDPSAEAKAALDGLGAAYFGPLGVSCASEKRVVAYVRVQHENSYRWCTV